MSVAQISEHQKPDVTFSLGNRLDGRGEPVVHSFQSSANFSHAVIGMSGVGKTYLMRRAALEYASQGVTLFVLDTQGDFTESQFRKHHGTLCDGIRFNEMSFGYTSTAFGLNPFTINTMEGENAFHLAAMNVIETFKLFNPSLGARQVTTLRGLIKEAYNRKGIYREDSSTWDNSPPTIDSLIEIVSDKRKAAKLGVDDDFYSEISSLRKEWRALAKKNEKSMEQGVENSEAIEGTIKQLSDQIMRLIEQEVQDPESTLNPSASVDSRLESVEDMIIGMKESMLFEGPAPTPRLGCINVLDFTNIIPRDQSSLFFLLLDRIFQAAIRTCKVKNPSLPNMVLFFDEVKVLAASAKSPMHPANRILTEGRKSGLGAFCGLQFPKQLPEEMKSSIATITLLPIAKEFRADAKKRFGVPEEFFERMRPKSDALVSFNNGTFIPVKLKA